MAGEIQALFNKYQQKYPLYTRDAIVELMLDDGVITFDTANKIKQGVSLFLLDNDSFKPAKQNDLSMTEIMGGNFSKTKTKPKTAFNRRIEPTKQPMTQGDCWLLSDINSLSYTSWGSKAIHDAIVPDEDGRGGVTIKFKGSPLKQKEIHITAYQIDEARKSGNYAEGDDDMIAFELATEHTFREMVRQGLATRVDVDKYMEFKGAKYRSYIWAGVKTKDFEQFPISELLGIKTYEVNFVCINEIKNAEKDKDKIFKYFSQNKNNISATCSFGFGLGMEGWGTKGSKDYIHGGHAYAIKNVNYGKDVTITDPHYSDYEIKIPWQVFNDLVENIIYSFKDSLTLQSLKNVLPKNYEINAKNLKDKMNKTKEEEDKQLKEELIAMQEKHIKQEEENEKRWKEKERQRSEQATKIALAKIKEAKSKNNVEILSNDSETFSSDTILAVLEEYPDIILWFDKEKSGWGNGTEKYWLINPIINALAQKAQEKGIDNESISQFKRKCYKELNAIIYTNEKVIQSEVEKMVKLIKSKS